MKIHISICFFILFLVVFSKISKADIFTLEVPKESFMKYPTGNDRPPSHPKEELQEESLVELQSRPEPIRDETEMPALIEMNFQLTRTCKVRTLPTENSVPTKVLPKGTNVTVTPYNKEWRKIGEAFLAGACLR